MPLAALPLRGTRAARVTWLYDGGSVDRMSNAPLAALLAQHFSVFNYDRRGRGDSGDTAPYAVDQHVIGILGVIGPTRMAYEHVIPIVDLTARLLSAALSQSGSRLESSGP